MNENREHNSSEGSIPDNVSQIVGNLAASKILEKLPKVSKLYYNTIYCRDKASTNPKNMTRIDRIE